MSNWRVQPALLETVRQRPRCAKTLESHYANLSNHRAYPTIVSLLASLRHEGSQTLVWQ
jgi:hypothetical protein